MNQDDVKALFCNANRCLETSELSCRGNPPRGDYGSILTNVVLTLAVAIAPSSCLFDRLERRQKVVFSASVDSSLYARLRRNSPILLSHL